MAQLQRSVEQEKDRVRGALGGHCAHKAAYGHCSLAYVPGLFLMHVDNVGLSSLCPCDIPACAHRSRR